MNNIVFIVPQLSQPRCIKRVATLQQAGFAVKVYGFDNALYSDNLKNLPFRVESVIKRKKEDTKIKKIHFFIKTIRNILRSNKGSVFYLFGFEFASIARLLGCKDYVYEEADVSAARYKNSAVRNVLLHIDRNNVKKSVCTVFTSQGFIDYLFPKNTPDNVILLPNKLSNYFNQQKRDEIQKSSIDYNHIKFGFIGLIRYPNTIVRFAKVIGRAFPKHEFHFYGDLERESYVDEEVKHFKNVFFHGAFSNPRDLASIYESIDISVVCYDIASGNVRIAEPNKLYESIFFETPLVVSKGTFLEQQVNRYAIGDAIDAASDKSIENYVEGISKERIEAYISRMRVIPSSELIDDGDAFVSSLKRYLNT